MLIVVKVSKLVIVREILAGEALGSNLNNDHKFILYVLILGYLILSLTQIANLGSIFVTHCLCNDNIILPILAEYYLPKSHPRYGNKHS